MEYVWATGGMLVKMVESHMANCTVQVLDLVAWKTHHVSMCVCLKPQKKGNMEKVDYGVTITYEGVLTFFLFLSGRCMHSLAHLRGKKKECIQPKNVKT